MTDKFLEEEFKTLLYNFGEINWNILTPEAWDKYINKDEPFNETQLEELRSFVKNFLDFLTDKPEKESK
jgi:hypothetical protein